MYLAQIWFFGVACGGHAVGSGRNAKRFNARSAVAYAKARRLSAVKVSGESVICRPHTGDAHLPSRQHTVTASGASSGGGIPWGYLALAALAYGIS